MANDLRALFESRPVEPETLKAMGDAFDLAVDKDGFADREALARAIFREASFGERDPGRLAERALKGLRRQVFSQNSWQLGSD